MGRRSSALRVGSLPELSKNEGLLNRCSDQAPKGAPEFPAAEKPYPVPGISCV